MVMVLVHDVEKTSTNGDKILLDICNIGTRRMKQTVLRDKSENETRQKSFVLTSCTPVFVSSSKKVQIDPLHFKDGLR
jgi:hypothetical protein